MQLDLFEETEESPYDLKARVNHLDERLEIIDDRTKKVQRGIFARHSELGKMYLQLKEELDELRESIGLRRKQATIYDLFGGERAI